MKVHDNRDQRVLLARRADSSSCQEVQVVAGRKVVGGIQPNPRDRMKTPFAMTVRFHDCPDEEMPDVQERERPVFLGNFGIKSDPPGFLVETSTELRFLAILRLADHELQELVTGLQPVDAKAGVTQFRSAVVVRQKIYYKPRQVFRTDEAPKHLRTIH